MLVHLQAVDNNNNQSIVVYKLLTQVPIINSGVKGEFQTVFLVEFIVRLLNKIIVYIADKSINDMVSAMLRHCTLYTIGVGRGAGRGTGACAPQYLSY